MRSYSRSRTTRGQDAPGARFTTTPRGRGDEHAGQLAQAPRRGSPGRASRLSRARSTPPTTRVSSPGRSTSHPDHHLRDGDPRRRRKSSGAVAGAFVITCSSRSSAATPIADARWVFYGSCSWLPRRAIRPWRCSLPYPGGLVAFGVVVHAIVGAVRRTRTAGPISTRSPSSRHDGWLAVAGYPALARVADRTPTRWPTFGSVQHRVRHAHRARPCADRSSRAGGGRATRADVWTAAFVWETRLALEDSPTTRPLLLGASSSALMVGAAAGTVRKPRVEIV